MKTSTMYVCTQTLLIGALVASAPAWAAGGLYGTVKQQARSVSGLELELACPGFGRSDQPTPSSPPQIIAARTDAQGGFTLRAPPMAKGRCELRVHGRGTPLEVFVSDSSLKYDLELDNQGNLQER